MRIEILDRSLVFQLVLGKEKGGRSLKVSVINCVLRTHTGSLAWLFSWDSLPDGRLPLTDNKLRHRIALYTQACTHTQTQAHTHTHNHTHTHACTHTHTHMKSRYSLPWQFSL